LNRRKPIDFVAEVNSHPLKSELFIELFEVATDAMRGKRRIIPPDAERCLEDAPPGTLYLADIRENQMGMSIVAECKKRFPGEEGTQISQSFLFRWFAFLKAHREGLLREFIKDETDTSQMVHSAVFEAAAECTLDADGDFDQTYLDRVKAIYDRDNGD
jgi:hypothetical protein